ncbi:unnamed protein product [Microthlaspi erraticum]|uniref:SWIM-type domain-containing protein n=1 Tax=Microthlaspi erraticum TaxID=1685480 RepID=A0A6D2KRG0_9BRAS|nr:unnamed protein product [Microthlaspi erraticum]
MAKGMSLDVEDFRVVKPTHGFASAETVRGSEYDREKVVADNIGAGDIVLLSQKTPDVGESSKTREPSIKSSGPVDELLDLHVKINSGNSVHGLSASVFPDSSPSDEEAASDSVTHLTKDMFPMFEGAATERKPVGANLDSLSDDKTKGKGPALSEGAGPSVPLEGIPVSIGSAGELFDGLFINIPDSTFSRDAAPVVDDPETEGVDRTANVVPDVSYEGDELFVGRVLKNKEDCKVKIAVHAINRKFSYRNESSNGDVVVVRCLSDTCPWRVYVGRMEESNYFQIRTAVLAHTCSVEIRGQFHCQATASVISEIMRSRYVGVARGPNLAAVQRAMLDHHRVRVSYWKAWRARELAMDSAKGSAAASYGLLPAYLHLLNVSNPGTITAIETEVDEAKQTRFKYCFVAFGGSVRGLEFIRKVMVIDGTHLRDSENDKAWEWFFGKLRQIVSDEDSLTFVSDMHSSIYAGLYKMYPRLSHGACIVHLQRNVAAKFKLRVLEPMISKAARAYRKSAFHDAFTEIELLSPACAEYLRSIGFHRWIRSHCDGDRYNIMTSNVVESHNAVLKEARELPIVSTLEYIRSTLMVWFTKRRDRASNHLSAVTPTVSAMIHTNFEKSTGFTVVKVNDHNYEIKTPMGTSFHVDLQMKTCTCEEWTLVKVPCSHAVGASIRADLPVHTLCDPAYSTFYWKLACQHSINPVPDLSNLYRVPDNIATLQILPPKTRRPPGRPKISRYLSSGEFKVYVAGHIC